MGPPEMPRDFSFPHKTVLNPRNIITACTNTLADFRSVKLWHSIAPLIKSFIELKETQENFPPRYLINPKY